MTKPKSAVEIKKKQQTNLIILITAVFLVSGLTYWFISARNDHKADEVKSKTETVSMAGPLQRVDAEGVLLEKAQTFTAEQIKETEAIKSKLGVIENDKTNKDKSDELFKSHLDEMSNKIQQLQLQVESMSAGGQVVAGQNTNSSGLAGKNYPKSVTEVVPSFQGIAEVNLDLSPNPNADDLKPIKNPDTYVPSGTFAKAVMIGGADASAAVNAQGNPSPMVFRIVADGTLPNKAHSHLKDCVVTAAVVGDISSERGMIRLESLSCTKPDNSIVDMVVEGTVFGPEGKNGVRGTPVRKEGALLGRAFAAGMFSGFSKGVQEGYTTNSVSALGSTSTVNNSDIAKNGAASGVSNSMDKIADYEIERAQQYHPVIQLSAGTTVDIVFMKGFFLDGKKHNEAADEAAVQNTGARTELFTHNNNPSATSSTLPLTESQMQKLKQHESELGFSSQPTATQG